MRISPFPTLLIGAIASFAVAGLALAPARTDAGITVAVTFTVNSTADDTDATCDPLTETTDCTFREALDAAEANNNQPVLDTIAFNIPDAGPHRITRADGSGTYFISEPVHIDGTTEPSFTAPTPAIIIDGASAGSTAIGFAPIGSSDGSIIEALSIVNFGNLAMEINGGNNLEIVGNYIGTEDGSTGAGNRSGILLRTGTGNTIGGTATSDRNLFVDQTDDGLGIFSDGNTVQGNYFGVGADGATPLGNGERLSRSSRLPTTR